jgi:allantoicase
VSFTALPDLAVRTLGGTVMAASDDSFAAKENLLNPGPAGFTAHTFGAKGQEYDGWETRRRRTPGHDWAVIRLGAAGVIRGVVIDTAWFTGNHPPYASVEACAAEGYPAADELTGWTEIVPRSPLTGDTAHDFAVSAERRFTHVRLVIEPDGGVARLRVHGEVVPDPRLLTGLTVDLAALANGAVVTGWSDMFYSSPANVIMPGTARHQAEGWETARRRDDGNDWITLRLAGRGVVRLAELDTANLRFNAPAAARVRGADARAGALDDEAAWFDLLPRTLLRPDTLHRFRLDGDRPATHARVDIYPDGGLARVRLHGSLTADGEESLIARWRALS